jgi:hypothetical protein
MDLVALGKKAILIPTPAQTEQLHLGQSLHEQGQFYSAPQRNFNLRHALDAAAHFPFLVPDVAQEYHRYKPVIDQWLTTL